MGFFQRDPQYKITVNGVEQRILVQALVTLKEKQQEENKNYDFIDDMIVKVCDAPILKEKGRCSNETR